MKTTALLAALLLLLAVPARAEPITPAEVRAAQQAWGEAIVAIGAAHAQGGDAQAEAQKTLDTLYAYDLGPVLFKPTKAAAEPFRSTRDSALSYFVGGAIPEDHGFALQPWSAVRFDDQQITADTDSAVAMGHYTFTDAASGAETRVEFTFGYLRDPAGRLRIHLHHSSLPYQPAH
jgi:hypothetical protein